MMEEKKDREYFKKLAHQLMFDLSDAEADSLVQEFGTLEGQMALLDAVNTDNVEEMIYPFEAETTFVRKDEVSNVISQDEAMANVEKKLEGHFVLPKVVK
jgi:aspartyl-tRNA(Asn)/glutamyl-tRNA(Gln) amidotransferase subunit C